MNSNLTKQSNAKKIFKEKGTCSRTFEYILNKEFDNPLPNEEQAADPLAGGIMRQGYQCGMLWGATLAIGAEAYKYTNDVNEASIRAIEATQNVMRSFIKKADSVNCRDITGCKMDTFYGMTKYMLKVMLQGMEKSTCFNLAEDWYHDAIESAASGLSKNGITEGQDVYNCAMEVVNNLGGSEKEMAMVAGFAGGMGLSGNGCGALSAAIWKRSLDWVEENPGKSAFGNKYAKSVLKKFMEVSNSEFECQQICNQKFESTRDHSEFIKKGGCRHIIDGISQI